METSTPANRWLRLERTGRNSEVEHSQSRPGLLQAVLTKWHIKSGKDGENSGGEDRSLSGSRPSSHLSPGEGPPRVPDLGFMERCSECDLTTWRVSRAGKAGKCELCKNERKRGTEMEKYRVCAWRMCATCHDLETRGESAPSPHEMVHTADEDHDTEMPYHDNTTIHRTRLGDEAPWPILKRLKNMPKTITFIPHRMRIRFARVYSSKLDELASLMREGDDTQEREMLNLLVWAIPALILREDEAETELHNEHHSRTAGLNQRLAAAGQDEWDGLIERRCQKQQDEEERRNANSNQVEDKEQTYLRRDEQSSKRTMVA